MAEIMTLSSNGLVELERWERFRPTLYDTDGGGHCTIGWGHLVHRGKCDDSPTERQFRQGITNNEATILLKNDVAWAEGVVRMKVTVPLTQSQYDALVSFVYNVGSGNFSGSTVLLRVNKGEHATVPNEMKKWIYSGGKPVPGLILRRTREAALYESK